MDTLNEKNYLNELWNSGEALESLVINPQLQK